MKSLRFFSIGILLCLCALHAQAQNVAFKTNALLWATTTTNIEAEVGLSNKSSLALMGAYNPWTFKVDKMMHTWAVQPEYKYWFCERFEGHFIGVHAHGAQFFGGFHSKRYDGYLVGAGVSWGYDWILSRHWNIEAQIGFGINYTWYKESDRLPCYKCGIDKDKTFFSPTKLAISLVYVL